MIKLSIHKRETTMTLILQPFNNIEACTDRYYEWHVIVTVNHYSVFF